MSITSSEQAKDIIKEFIQRSNKGDMNITDLRSVLIDLSDWINLAGGKQGNSLFVSSKGLTVSEGAVRESLGTHFSSLDEAVVAAISGDTIYVYGDHTINSSLSKAGVGYSFSGNGTISCNVTAFTDDAGSALSMYVRGDAKFVCIEGAAFLHCVTPGSSYDIEIQSASTRGYQVAYIESGTTTSRLVATHELINLFDDHTIYLQKDARGTITCPRIASTATYAVIRYALYVFGDYTGDFRIIGNVISENSENAVALGVNTGNAGKLTIDGDVYGSTQAYGGTFERSAVRLTGGTLQLNGNIYGYDRHCVEIAGTETIFNHVGNMYTTGIYSCLTTSTNATPVINIKGNQEVTSAATVIEINSIGGSFRHSGRVENKFISGGTTARGISLGASSDYIAVFEGSVIVVSDAFNASGIIAPSSKDITVLSSLVSNVPFTNVTNNITGTIFVSDSNII